MYLTESQLEIKSKCMFLNELGIAAGVDTKFSDEIENFRGNISAIIGQYHRSISKLNKNNFLKRVKDADMKFLSRFPTYKPKTSEIDRNDEYAINLLWKNEKTGIGNCFNFSTWNKMCKFKINGRWFFMGVSSSLKQYNTNEGNINYVYVLYETKKKGQGQMKFYTISLGKECFN